MKDYIPYAEELLDEIQSEHIPEFSLGLTYKAIKWVIFNTMTPDQAHEIGQWVFRRNAIWKLYEMKNEILGKDSINDERLETELFPGVVLRNPLILAAGFDKDGEIISAMCNLGYGADTIGSVMYEKPANPKPRIVRYSGNNQLSACNSFGMPSHGHDYVAKKIRDLGTDTRMKIIANVSGRSLQEYVDGVEKMQPYADAIEINNSCPNTSDGKKFEEDVDMFRNQLDRLSEVKKKPISIKISPVPRNNGMEKTLELVGICQDYHMGVTLVNTQTAKESGLGRGIGGFSGPGLYFGNKFYRGLNETVEHIYREMGEDVVLIPTGGIFTGKQAYELIRLGAGGVGALTALIFRMFSFPRDLNRELLEEMDKNNIYSIRDLRGTGLKR